MNALLIAATVAIVSTFPEPLPGHGGGVLFHKNELQIVFNQPVVTHAIEVTDDKGCKVSQSSVAEGEKVIVRLQACERIGYPPGHMHVNWTVNGVKGEHHMHVRRHH